MDVPSRVPRLRASFDGAGCDALLVTNLISIRYLTGFTGSAAMLLVLPNELLFVTDGRYGDQSREQLARAGVEAKVEVGTTLAAQRDTVAATARGIARIGLEADHVTWAQQRAMADAWFADSEVVAT
ncbi:MAG: aminopeptidase P family N-terminal domain-containing protein, partial [Actinomycetota bacterium]